MTCSNAKSDLVSMKAYVKYGEHMSVCLKILSRNKILALIKGHNSGTNLVKTTCNNPKLDHVNINANTKFE